jgi:hypothetical protein
VRIVVLPQVKEATELALHKGPDNLFIRTFQQARAKPRVYAHRQADDLVGQNVIHAGRVAASALSRVNPLEPAADFTYDSYTNLT